MTGLDDILSEPTIARFESVCGECNGVIRVGAPIVADEFDEWGGTWNHAACPPTKFDFKPEDVCGDCFTVKSASGACACLS